MPPYETPPSHAGHAHMGWAWPGQACAMELTTLMKLTDRETHGMIKIEEQGRRLKRGHCSRVTVTKPLPRVKSRWLLGHARRCCKDAVPRTTHSGPVPAPESVAHWQETKKTNKWVLGLDSGSQHPHRSSGKMPDDKELLQAYASMLLRLLPDTLIRVMHLEIEP